ncbi:Aste57867_22671 [Aphanomyces stellatus]|uniref:Aste57867_22671 protein n=1 Tax=Aphanomyces stellatus TaxID=120398 RepID=A0A485LKV5_9STRA|nr:hypothetical protein As57867_022601 [Aphanomyces stellatus]VFT99325.1 Aste57867_22671 [Aphanomyces stellatus]
MRQNTRLFSFAKNDMPSSLWILHRSLQLHQAELVLIQMKTLICLTVLSFFHVDAALPPLTSSTGWQPCTIENRKFDRVQCNNFTAPLCYPGRCDSLRSINVFVKRILSNSTKANRSVWVLDGGPGIASVGMEPLMQKLYDDLGGDWTLYTMDHRGTGRSERLACGDKTSDAVCVNALHAKYGDNAAGFSVTSAASDIVALSHSIDPTSLWFVYGVSYGSFLVERVMHVANDAGVSFRGFVLDSVIPETMLVPNAEADYAIIAGRFLDACDANAACHELVGSQPLRDRVTQFYVDIDKLSSPSSSFCHQWLLHQAEDDDESGVASTAAKKLFASLIRDGDTRNLFPPLFVKLARCAATDYAALDTFADFLDAGDVYEDNFDNPTVDSPTLYNVIAYSERQIWFNAPTPSLATLERQFRSEVIAEGFYEQLPLACLYTNHAAAACDDLDLPTTASFVYKPDEYFGRVAAVPSDASVLVLNGNLDVITPDTQAKYQFDAYDTRRKLYVNVTHAAHNAAGTACGYAALFSYLEAVGDVAKVNKTCGVMPPLSFGITDAVALDAFGSLDDIILVDAPTSPIPTTRLPMPVASSAAASATIVVASIMASMAL